MQKIKMRKETITKIIIGVLLTLNLLQLSSFLLTPKQHPENFQDEAIQILNLNAEQQKSFHKFAKKHANKMKSFYDEEIRLATQYFNKPSDSLLNAMANIENAKVKATDNHFNAIKNILQTSQLKYFTAFKKEALQHIFGQENSNIPPPHN
jgi:predicted negative regulator of RcsB-dependent stress response